MKAPFRAAAVQAAPAFLDVEATLEKLAQYVSRAAAEGADLVVFPEVFIAGYPYWNWLYSPLDGSPWFRRLYDSAVELPGPTLDILCELARVHGVYIATGLNEKDQLSHGTLYNTNVLISPERGLINKRRKLVPTFAEKLSWAPGDARGLTAVQTGLGRIGMLACGENTNTLARFALLAEGEQIHIANFIAYPFGGGYDMPEAIRMRCAAHSFEGKVFSIVACSSMSPEIVDMLARNAHERAQLTGLGNAFSGIIDPHGRLLTAPLVDVEGIVYADIDLSATIEPKQFQDITGHYNRFDIFQLHVDRSERPGLIDVAARSI